MNTYHIPGTAAVACSEVLDEKNLSKVNEQIADKVDNHMSILSASYAHDELRRLRPIWIEHEWRKVAENFNDVVSIKQKGGN